MSRSVQNHANISINQTVDKIMELGQITRQEHLQLTSAILYGYHITDEQRHQINRVFDSLQMGSVKIAD